MGVGYQKTDRKVVDYDLWFMGGQNLAIRGPQYDFSFQGNRLACLGAAQTFGRFVKDPYPNQLGKLLGQPIINFGFSGAGPEYFLKRKALISSVQEFETVIFQVMSARSVSAGAFECNHKNNGMLRQLDGADNGWRLAAIALKSFFEEFGPSAFKAQIEQQQKAWLEGYIQLGKFFTGRKILLWMSEIEPRNALNLESFDMTTFPHFVTSQMLSELQKEGFELVQAVRASPIKQLLLNDLTGTVEAVFSKHLFPNRPYHTQEINTYYPDQKMHDLVTGQLLNALFK